MLSAEVVVDGKFGSASAVKGRGDKAETILTVPDLSSYSKTTDHTPALCSKVEADYSLCPNTWRDGEQIG